MLVVAYYVFAWFKVGRDPPEGTIIPLFEPPEGMSAAAVRYVDQMGFDNRAFTAAIIELGVNGHIKLTESAGATQIDRRDGGKPIGRAEQALETKLFSGNERYVLAEAGSTTPESVRPRMLSRMSWRRTTRASSLPTTTVGLRSAWWRPSR